MDSNVHIISSVIVLQVVDEQEEVLTTIKDQFNLAYLG